MWFYPLDQQYYSSTTQQIQLNKLRPGNQISQLSQKELPYFGISDNTASQLFILPTGTVLAFLLRSS